MSLENIHDWIILVSKSIRKMADLFDRRWEENLTSYQQLELDKIFTADRDGMALLKVAPNSADSKNFIIHKEHNDDRTILYKIKEFTGTSRDDVVQFWIPIQKGHGYKVQGESVTVQIAYLYFRK